MYSRSSLSQAQRLSAVVLFEAGWGATSVATRLGVARWPIKAFYQRWRIRGRGALFMSPTKRSYSFEVKIEVARRHLAGETKTALAQEFDLSSPQLVYAWSRILRDQGEDGLKPTQRGRPPAHAVPTDEVMALRREIKRLRAENAYLGKLQALVEQQRRSR